MAYKVRDERDLPPNVREALERQGEIGRRAVLSGAVNMGVDIGAVDPGDHDQIARMAAPAPEPSRGSAAAAGDASRARVGFFDVFWATVGLATAGAVLLAVVQGVYG